MRPYLYALVIALYAYAPFANGAERTWGPSTVIDRTGEPLDLARTLQSGHHIVFVFWQSWCASCKKEAPALVEASRRFGGQAQFVGVISGPENRIDERKVDQFILQTKLPYPQVRDKDLRLTREFDVKGTPTIIVIAPDGRIVYYGHRAPSSWSNVFAS